MINTRTYSCVIILFYITLAQDALFYYILWPMSTMIRCYFEFLVHKISWSLDSWIINLSFSFSVHPNLDINLLIVTLWLVKISRHLMSKCFAMLVIAQAPKYDTNFSFSSFSYLFYHQRNNFLLLLRVIFSLLSFHYHFLERHCWSKLLATIFIILVKFHTQYWI